MYAVAEPMRLTLTMPGGRALAPPERLPLQAPQHPQTGIDTRGRQLDRPRGLSAACACLSTPVPVRLLPGLAAWQRPCRRFRRRRYAVHGSFYPGRLAAGFPPASVQRHRCCGHRRRQQRSAHPPVLLLIPPGPALLRACPHGRPRHALETDGHQVHPGSPLGVEGAERGGRPPILDDLPFGHPLPARPVGAIDWNTGRQLKLEKRAGFACGRARRRQRSRGQSRARGALAGWRPR